MASTPGFGTTNGVADLNLGQEGSDRASTSKADYAVKVTRQNEEDGTTLRDERAPGEVSCGWWT
jgi:hypothetical protein